MLYFSRWKTAAILGMTLMVCVPALTNVLPAHTFDSLPTWAQRKIALGIDLHGGSHYQLAVDADFVRKEMARRMFGDARKLLREARIAHSGLSIRDDGVEIRIRQASDMPRALGQFRRLMEAGIAVEGQLVRLTLAESSISERIEQARRKSMDVIDRFLRVTGVEFRMWPVGSDRVAVDTLGPEERWRRVQF